MKEGFYNNRVKEAIRRTGVYCYKTADRFQKGIPDIYVAGGNWIEGKAIMMPKRDSVSVIKHVEPAQRILLNSLTKAGDKCFLSIYWQNEYAVRYYTFIPWIALKQILVWRLHTIHELSKPLNPAKHDYEMERFFRRDVPGYYTSQWWDTVFGLWVEENKSDWDPDYADADKSIYEMMPGIADEYL